MTIAVGGEYDDSEGYFVRPDGAAVRRPDRRGVLAPSTSARSSPCTCIPTTTAGTTCSTSSTRGSKYALTGAVIADDRAAVLAAAGPIALRGRQLLRQRQADRRRRRAAAVRRIAGVGHQRQGGLGAEPAALDVGAVDQGDVRPADRPRLPAHGGDDDGRPVRPASPARRSWPPAGRDGLRRTAERLPVTRRVVHRFVPGETVDDALTSVAELRDSGRFVSIDYLGEDVTDADAANATVDAYLELLDALGQRAEADATACGRWRCR